MLRWEDWLAQARGDRLAAENLRSSHNWDWCCFACQQSAEKYLKAALDARRIDKEGHYLPGLLARLASTVAVPEEVTDACAILNRLYIPTRYPDAHQEGAPIDVYRERDARDALRELGIVAEFIESIVRAPES